MLYNENKVLAGSIYLFYIISEVVYATKTSILVKIDGKERAEKVNLKIQVAFSYA